MLGSNWKALIASNKVQVGTKRKADDGAGETAAAASNTSAAASGQAT